MPLQQTSGNSTTDAYGGGAALVPNYIESCFSTYLYTGTGATQTITNGIDLAGKGGLTWIKARNTSTNHKLFDSAQAGTPTNWDYSLTSNSTAAATYYAQVPILAQTTGFRINSPDSAFINESGNTYCSWTFRKQPKFFDVVTYTGTGSARTVAHSLGAVPGCIIVKRTDAAGYNWFVYHVSLGNSSGIVLNQTDGAGGYGTALWNSTDPTSTVFSLGTNSNVNASGGTYVAYLFAHNAGGFGLLGTDNVITCGSFTSSAGGLATVNLGYEPQWVIVKGATGVTHWQIMDTMRGFVVGAANANSKYLNANSSSAELDTPPSGLTNTGFDFNGAPSITYIYIAIRRGPMKVPTDGTKVFYPYAASSPGNAVVTTGFPVDLQMQKNAGSATDMRFVDRLRGVSTTPTSPSLAFPLLVPSDTTAESTGTGTTLDWGNTGFTVGNTYAGSAKAWAVNFRRAPGFFDEVCYTDPTSGTTVVNHNLGVVPQLIIQKSRAGTGNWYVWSSTFTNPLFSVFLNSSIAADAFRGTSPSPTSTQFTAETIYISGTGGCVAYLFATCPGVSKVFSFTGNGSTQTINCGFAGGARFVLIKRTDAAGNWYTYDTARGMTTLTDPYLLLNSTAAETATLGSVTTVTTGFALNSAITAAINVSGGTYIFLAIA